MSSGTFTNVCLLHGPNAYLLEKALEKLRADFEEKHGSINIETIATDDDLTAQKIISAISSAPFLGEKRLVVVKNFLRLADDKEQEKMEKSLDKIPETGILVFFEHPNTESKKRPKATLKKTLEKKAVAKVFNEGTENELMPWIINRLKNNNAVMSETLARYMMEVAGTDMHILASECEKLGIYCHDRKVTQRDIDDLVSKNYATTIFQCTDALNEKNPQKAIAKLHVLSEMGEELLIILSMMARHFRLILLTKELIEKQKIPRSRLYETMTTYDAGLKPYPVKLAADQAQKFTMAQLKSVMNTLVQISLDAKTGRPPILSQEKNGLLFAMERLIISLAQPTQPHR